MIDHLKFFLVFVLIIHSSFPALSQVNAHYWTNQYGSKGLLLNGAVIATPNDETSAFYNPGAIGMDDNLGFLFSFITPTYSNLETTNVLGDGNSISDKGFSFAPSFFGIRLRPFKNKNITVAISNFKRYSSDVSLNDRVTSTIDQNSDHVYRVDLDFDREMSESWRGIGFAYNLNDKIGIGLSQFSVWHSQQYSFELSDEIHTSSDPTELNQFSRLRSNYKFNLSSAFITKLGLSYRSHNLCFGLTYTSPLYGTLYRSGSYNLENQIVDKLNALSSSLSNRNKTSDITYKTPHSVGMGIDIHRKRTSISISSEYFWGIKEYNILNEIGDSFEGISAITSETIFKVESKNEPVINFAIGVQNELSEKASLVFGFRTDFDQKNNLGVNDAPDYLGTVGNVYHFTGGSMINYSNNQFSCGFDLGIGKRTGGNQIVDLSAVTPTQYPTLNGKENVNSRFSSFMIFITYDFIFKRFKKDDQ